MDWRPVAAVAAPAIPGMVMVRKGTQKMEQPYGIYWEIVGFNGI